MSVEHGLTERDVLHWENPAMKVVLPGMLLGSTEAAGISVNDPGRFELQPLTFVQVGSHAFVV